MHFGHSNPRNAYSLNQNLLEISTEEKDLGVHVSDSFKFSNHISKIAAKANSILGRINRAFENKDKEIIKLLYVSMVRPHLEYAVQSWSPYLRKDNYIPSRASTKKSHSSHSRDKPFVIRGEVESPKSHKLGRQTHQRRSN